MPARPSLLALIPVLAFGAAALLFALGLDRDRSGGVTKGLIDRPAPTFELGQLNGLPVPETADLHAGGLKLINFWASWCAPCRAEHPNLTALAGEGLKIYGVNYRDDPGQAQGFLDELGNPYVAVGTDPQGMAALDWGVYGIPETFLVDEEGQIIFRHAGPLTKRIIDAQLRPILEARNG